MELLLGLIPIAIALAALLVVMQRRRSDLRTALRGLDHEIRKEWGMPEASFTYRGAPGRILHTGMGEAGQTIVQLVAPEDLPGRLKVMRDINLPNFNRLNLTDLKVGDPRFDELFLIEADPAEFASRALTEKTRGAFHALRSALIRHSVHAGIHLALGGRNLLLTLPHTIDGRILGPAVDVVISIADSFLVEGEPGRALADAMQIMIATGTCLVCGMGMEAETVRCAKCRTPHHKDCFAYFGRCAVFGCASREAI